MRYRFPYVGADLRKLFQQPGIQRTLRDHGYGLVYLAICLFTPQLSPGTHFSLTTDGTGTAPRWFTHQKTVTHLGTNPT